MSPSSEVAQSSSDSQAEASGSGAKEQRPLNLLLVDDHVMVRDGLRSLLEFAGFRVVGEASDGREALALVQRLKPDVVLMDISMPEFNGEAATVRLTQEAPGVKVIALSMHSNRRRVLAMFKAGAAGYLTKLAPAQELIDAIHTVATGLKYVSPMVAAGLVDCLGDGGSDAKPSKDLTVREREVLQLVAEGKSSKEVAKKLLLAVATVESHRRQISEKLELRSIAELTKYAIREGLTQVE